MADTFRFPSPPPDYRNHGVPASDHGDDHDASRQTPPSTIPHRNALTPYLTLPHLLSLTWLAYPILSLLFVAFRLVISSGSAQDAVVDAKGQLMTSCQAAQSAATVAASLPRYMAQGTNAQIIDAVNASMTAARVLMTFSLTIVQAVIEFAIDIYRSTFLCFLELVVRGGLSILIGSVQEISDAVTASLNAIRTSIQGDVAFANKAISTAVSAINKVTSIVNVNLNVPQFDIPSLSALNNVTIPTGFEDSLVKLNSSLPTLDDLRDKLDAVISIPFDAIKKDINDTFATIQFNESVLELPAQRTMSFCSSMDTSVVDDLGRDLVKITRIGAALLVVAALLLIAGNCFVQWWSWRSLQNHLEYTREAWRSDPTIVHSNPLQPNAAPMFEMSNHNLMMLYNTAEHPLLSRIADNITRVLRLTPSQHINMRFFASYVFYAPALACLLIGAFGLLSIELQLVAIAPLQKHYSAKVASSVNDFSSQIAGNINGAMGEQSAAYAAQVNTHLTDIQTTINNGVFGWVNTTTTTLNNTLVAFYSDLQQAVNSTLGGTVLDSPAQEFLRCMIGTKIQSLENALTFLHDNLQVNMPVMSNNILMLSNDTVDEVTKPIALAAVGGSASGDTNSGAGEGGLVGKLIARYVAALKKERLMFCIFLGLWAFVAFLAILIILWHSYGVDALEEHKRRRYLKERRNIVVPWFHRDQASRQFDGSTPRVASMAAPEHHSTTTIADAAIANEKDRRHFSNRLGISTSVDGSKSPNEYDPDLQSFTPLATPKRSRFLSALSPTFGSTSMDDRYPTPSGAATSSSKETHLHPLAHLNPRFEKSWDSFLDAKDRDLESGDKGKGGMKWNGGSKLRNDSRRVTKRDLLDYTPPESQEDLSTSEREAENAGWLKKTFGVSGFSLWRSNTTHRASTTAEEKMDNRHSVVIPADEKEPSVPIIIHTTPSRSFDSAPPQLELSLGGTLRGQDFSQSMHDTPSNDIQSSYPQTTSPPPAFSSVPIHHHFVGGAPQVTDPFVDQPSMASAPRASQISLRPPPGLLATRNLTNTSLKQGTNPFISPLDARHSGSTTSQGPPTPFSTKYGRAI